ncbi:hypothetical protein MTO96_045391 [Rhipicephalus appendiculatus]
MSVPDANIDHTQTIRDVLRQRGLTFPAQEVLSTRKVFGILVALTLQDLLGVFFQLKLTPYLKEHDRLVFELKYAETMYRYVSDVEILEWCVRAYDPPSRKRPRLGREASQRGDRCQNHHNDAHQR